MEYLESNQSNNISINLRSRCNKLLDCQRALIVLFICCTIVASIHLLISNKRTTFTRSDESQSSPANQASALQNDGNLQNCIVKPDKTFPGFDYSLYGYNILKGYPRSFGNDPGFTFPIFTARYSGKQSADCKYSIPDGLVVLHDIACTTSFNSKIIETSYEFYRSVSSSVDVMFGLLSIFGFKASVGYKESLSVISSGTSVYITSSAECQYYFSKLDINSPPTFSTSFLDWVYKLSKANNTNTDLYMEFFNTFGTHFPTQITFGAEYTFEHTMSAQLYKTERQKGTNIAVSAGYAAQFQVNGGFSLDNGEQEIASKFNKMVSTRTITKGAAPPASGNAMEWASMVKDNPVPVKYKLAFISDLFSTRFMSSLGISFQIVSENINRYYPLYCKTLQLEGLLDSCSDDSGQLTVMSTRLWSHDKDKQVELLTECIDECLSTTNCTAITFWKGRSTTVQSVFTCHMFTAFLAAKTTTDKEWETIFFKPSPVGEYINQTKPFMLNNAAINGQTRNTINSPAATENQCLNRCITDKHCTAVTFSSGQPINCKLFAGNRINHFYKDEDSKSYVLLDRISNY